MAIHHVRRFGCVITLSTIAIALFLVANPAHAQDRKAPQSAGVDNTKMGPYRALAQLAFSASQKGDNATAATLAKVLERTWDKGEDYGGDTALSKTNKKLFEEIDKAMDSFVNLLVEHAATGADQGKLKIVYNAYLSKLKLAD